jgi:hypothetical protein
LLKKVNKGILELNTFEKVLKSQKVISNIWDISSTTKSVLL